MGRRGRPKAELILSEAEHAQLTSFARSRSMPAALARAHCARVCNWAIQHRGGEALRV